MPRRLVLFLALIVLSAHFAAVRPMAQEGESAQPAPAPEASQAQPPEALKAQEPEAPQAAAAAETPQAPEAPQAAAAAETPQPPEAPQTQPTTALTVTPAAASPEAAPQPGAAPALDAAPSGDSTPDPLTPPEDKEPAPAAPGARALPTLEAPAQENANPAVTQIRSQLSEHPTPSRNDDKEDLGGMRAFYGEGSGQTIWTSADGFNERALKAIAEVRKAGEWGLDPKAFELPEPPVAQAAPEALASAEIKLSVAVLKYARYARGGRINPRTLSPNLDRKPRIYDPKTVLQAVASAEASDAYLRGLHPKHEQFQLLRKALLSGLKPAAPGTDVQIPTGPKLKPVKPGEQHPDVALIRQRLNVSEGGTDGQPDVYDDALVEAVKAFQKAHDLKANGVIDRKLRAALNEKAADTPDAKRMRILANMEKWRWMPDDLGEFYVWNSVPEQTTRVFDNGKQVFMEKIVVGKPGTPTPIFSANMQFVIFQPEWNVPEGIKTKELWPRLRQAGGGGFFGGGNGSAVLAAYGLRATLNGREVDADSVDWSNTDIRRFQFTQPSGAKNVLGVVKFRFPNKHDVYMHDTPERHLFGSGKRAFSHGCMRVQNPVRLAEVLLARDKGWSAARVRELAASGRSGQNEITLTKQIPVHVTYFTLTVDESGALQSHSDVYGLDGDIIGALKGKPMDVTAASTVAAAEEQAQPQASARPGSRRNASHSRRRRPRNDFFWD